MSGSRRSTWALVLICAVIVACDLYTKQLAELHLTSASPVRVIGDYVRLTLVHNTGTAFGLFPGNRIPFIAFSFIAIFVILGMYVRLRERSHAQLIAMGLLLGGAIGNLHDRMRFGEVTDFLQVGVAGHYWPVFNVADSAISVGVVLLVLTLLRAEHLDDDDTEDDGLVVSAGDVDQRALDSTPRDATDPLASARAPQPRADGDE